MTTTLSNDFHNSTCEVRAEVDVDSDGSQTLPLTKSQWRRVNRELCGMDDCDCGVVRGEDNPHCIAIDGGDTIYR